MKWVHTGCPNEDISPEKDKGADGLIRCWKCGGEAREVVEEDRQYSFDYAIDAYKHGSKVATEKAPSIRGIYSHILDARELFTYKDLKLAFDVRVKGADIGTDEIWMTQDLARTVGVVSDHWFSVPVRIVPSLSLSSPFPSYDEMIRHIRPTWVPYTPPTNPGWKLGCYCQECQSEAEKETQEEDVREIAYGGALFRIVNSHIEYNQGTGWKPL